MAKKHVYTAYADAGEVEAYLYGAEEWLHRIRKAKGFAVTVPAASTGFTKVIDIAAKNEADARRISCELRHTPLEIEQFKGVFRGEPKVVRDPCEKERLRTLAQEFLQRSLDKVRIEGAGRSIVEAVKLRKAIRYGQNVYVMVVRFTQENHPTPGWEGGNIHKGDQGLAFAGDINIDNTPVAF